ncbi:restriction endonuclease subunit S [Leptolyngbya cf. ectocarpi LEGE 11479]|uniref:Restriction endonuclease subunit S n=1 Tax=Leptolyngbya cf. ectocarpi LEGE 11479 TaxID=1828722 RepID=A0A929FDV6_LEPEC|nr:restriction endonuclease subunit S [Leptolyngbya ectocarpi]MBE9070973.1 restriction endonuclease subunit S [Leptolyngbya cf. ectocarpi LEGE 11479]
MNEGGDNDKLGRGTVWHGQISPCLHQNHVFAIRPNEDLRPDWLATFTQSEQARTYFHLNAKQSTNLASISATNIMSLSLPLPSVSEQQQILSYLDHETARIDALIAEQERLIELLKEKRQAVISHAVTKGLDPTTPMRDSGVEWIGAVPKHWEVKQLKHIIDPATSITYGIVQAGPEVENGIPYIKTSDMAGDELPLEGYSRTSPEIDSSYQRSKVSTGDIVIAIRATVGKCLPVPPELEGANLTQGTAKVSPGVSVIADYLLLAIRAEAAQAYFGFMSKGATFKEITLDALRRTPLALPPLPEQSHIVAQLKSVLDNLEALISEALKTQSLLSERRSALISAAVTGKIDVRDWKAPASDSPAATLETAYD